MGLFGKKSEEEELVNKLVGGFLLSGEFRDLAKLNGLYKKVDDNNEDIAICEDIKIILKEKVKNDEMSLDEIELYFYYIFKQAMYIDQNLFFKEGYCNICTKDMEDDKYHIFACPRCGKDFFDSYIIDYDDLDKLEIKFPNDSKSPYRDLGDDLSKYIQKHKPQSNYEKIKKVLPKCLDKLGVSEDNYYIVEILTKINSDEFSPIKLSILAIHDDKFSFIPIGEYYRDTGYSFYEDKEKDVLFETTVNFDEIVNFTLPYNNVCQVVIENDNAVLIRYLRTKTSLDNLINNFTSFKEKPREQSQSSSNLEEPNENIEEFELPQGVNPMEKIKEAKELFDIGAITEEEFNEIKTKYMKFI